MRKQVGISDAKRSSCIRVPYFGVALQCLPGTELVLTLTSGLTSVVKGDRKLRLVNAAQELHGFHFLMAWHRDSTPIRVTCGCARRCVDNCRSQWVSPQRYSVNHHRSERWVNYWVAAASPASPAGRLA